MNKSVDECGVVVEQYRQEKYRSTLMKNCLGATLHDTKLK